MTLADFRRRYLYRQSLPVEIFATDDAGRILPGALLVDLDGADAVERVLRAVALLGPRGRVRSKDYGLTWDGAGALADAEPPTLTSDDPNAPSLWGKQQETLDL